MSTNKPKIVNVNKSDLEYVYSLLDVLYGIGSELRFKEESQARRIRNLSRNAKNTLQRYRD